MKVDRKDRKIISILAIDPHISQDRVASLVGLSQPSVAARIKNLRKNGVLATNVGLDPLRMGLNVCMVSMRAADPKKILSIFQGCPFFINGYTLSGKNNLCIFFMGENISTMESIINNHLRSEESVQEIEFNIIISYERPLVVPTRLVALEETESLCDEAMNCDECPNFCKHQCTGCPVEENYKGWLFTP